MSFLFKLIKICFQLTPNSSELKSNKLLLEKIDEDRPQFNS